MMSGNAGMRSRLLAALLALPLAGTVQAAAIAWAHDSAPRGDGTRTFLHGSVRIGGAFPFDLAVEQPAFDARAVVGDAGGAWLIVPASNGGGTANLELLLPPSWLRTQGWQVIRIDRDGAVQWSRHLAASLQPGAGAPLRSEFLLAPQLLQTRLTADGALALLSTRGLHVFDADGELRQAIESIGALCPALLPDYRGPTQQFLTGEDRLVVGFGSDGEGEPRACAVDFDGVERARFDSQATYLDVGDYREGIGFLALEREWNGSSWSDGTLSLRDGDTQRWSLPGMEQHTPVQGPQISPDGDTWLQLDDTFAKLTPTGQIAWQVPWVGVPESNPIAWLADGSLLLASTDHASVRTLHAADGSGWQRSFGALTAANQPAAWEIDAERIRIFGHLPDTDVARIVELAADDGALRGERIIGGTQGERRLAYGALAGDRVIEVAAGAGEPGWERGAFPACQETEFCPDRATFATPQLRVYDGATGAMLIDAGYAPGFPLPAWPLERHAGPRVSAEIAGATGVLFAQYVHDGRRSCVQVERLDRAGRVQWTQRLGFDGYDAADASIYHSSSGVYLIATEHGPASNAGAARAWKLAPDSGEPMWARDLPFALQQLRPLPVDSNGLGVCGISELPPYRLACYSAAGALTRSVELQDAPEGARLVSAGTVVLDGKLSIRVRVMPSSAAFDDHFQFGGVDQNGTYRQQYRLEFAPPAAGHRLRADALDSQHRIATAALYANTSGYGEAASLQVARFDANGTRLWQTAIQTPQRSYLDGVESTSIALSEAGEIHVSLHPQRGDGTFPTAVCRLSDAGALLGCADAPRQGRIVSLLSFGAGDGVWAWLRGYLDDTRTTLGMFLHRVNASGFSDAIAQVDSHLSPTPDARSAYDGHAWFVLSSNGVGSDRASSDTRLIEIHLNESLFADGFEN